MSTRYVWSKWNVNKTAVKLGSSTSIDTGMRTSAYIVQSSSYSISNNKFILNNGDALLVGKYPAVQVVRITGGNWFAHILNDVSNPSKEPTTVLYKSTSTGLTVTYNESIDQNELQLSAPTDWYGVGTKKGSTSYGNVSSANSGTYPANSYSGSYWYVSLGSDTIDPVSLSYTDPVKAGGTVNLTITPSSGIVHGGNITYTIQTTTNGEDYYDAGTTTGTTFAVTVPQDAAIWNVRVYAKDDTGFVSTTYVYGNGNDQWVTVIQSEIVPASGDLGYLTSKNIVAVGVTHVSETMYSLSANLNGSPCFSVSDVPIDTATFITLEDETWESIPQETEQTLDVTITFTGSTDTRNYTFKKFTYDDTSLEGVMEGTARAIRIKREYQTQVLGKNMPKEIIKVDNPVNTSGLKEATASEAQVFKGYTFFAGDSELREGTALSTPTTVTVGEVVKGKTYYDEEGILQTGTGAKALQYKKGSVYVGWSGGSGTINLGFKPKWFAFSNTTQVANGGTSGYYGKSTGSFDGSTSVATISETQHAYTGGNAPTAIRVSFSGTNASYYVKKSILTGSLYWWALG